MPANYWNNAGGLDNPPICAHVQGAILVAFSFRNQIYAHILAGTDGFLYPSSVLRERTCTRLCVSVFHENQNACKALVAFIIHRCVNSLLLFDLQVIANCIVLLILSSALPVLSRTLGKYVRVINGTINVVTTQDMHVMVKKARVTRIHLD